jgi:hypothetical protein
VLDFHHEIPAGFILAGVEKFRELTGENPPIMRVFALWCRTQWTDLYRFSKREETVLRIARSFFDYGDKGKFFAYFLPLYATEGRKSLRSDN